MSSYSYQPKVFRYKNGCCICKAKSSSSRFTSSQKYECEFSSCFNLKEERSGKICNACVLIFKRWRKLPDRYSRNWEHVVDSKDKQGRKSLKVRRKPEKTEFSDKSNTLKKHRYVPKSSRLDDLSDDQGLGDDCSGSSASSISGEERLSEGSFSSMPSSLASSPHPLHYTCDDDVETSRTKMLHAILGSSRRKPEKNSIQSSSKKTQSQHDSDFSTFVDTEYWREEKVCCGLIYRGECGEILIDSRFFKPCCQISAKKIPSGLSRTTSSLSSTCSRQCENRSSSSKFDEVGVDSFYEENPVDTLFSSRVSSGNDQIPSTSGINMLMQYSTALVI